MDRYAIKPVAEGYRDYLPSPVRKAVRSMLDNLSEPWSFVNEVLQGEFQRSAVTLGRFAINSTAGILGMIDLMQTLLGEAYREDFGQTLAVWGVGDGPYLVLPLLGPSSPRDAAGTGVGFFLDPADIGLALVAPPYAMAAKTVVSGIDKREKYLSALDQIEKSSLDYYASMRSLYRQKRGDEIRNGKSAPNLPSPGLTFEDDDLPQASRPVAGSPVKRGEPRLLWKTPAPASSRSAASRQRAASWDEPSSRSPVPLGS
jgi:phospholipid-binding lipoprotein MlaA